MPDRAPQIFHRSFNAISRITVFGSAVLVGGVFWSIGAIERSPWRTQVGVVRSQPVPFSHRHHVDGLGIDCRYCHSSVEVAPSAGMPSSKVCMTCHSILWDRAEMLEPVRESFRSGSSIPWTRVYDLLDFVYFDHSIHVAKGVPCVSCHGRVDRMPLTWRVESLHMEWCLECHRNPTSRLRPPRYVTEPSWVPGEGDPAGAELAGLLDVRPRDSCCTCHR